MGGNGAKFKSLTALGEVYAVMLLDRSSILLASTKIWKLIKPANFAGFLLFIGSVGSGGEQEYDFKQKSDNDV
ncbi:hypothetical protein SpAn4DRAFT_1326 [Sporomusa ovata]|uniref:Uncharacterized protein n=1 Tax=Sporomusa ovata TaxID=2378 RepID=A0A0U1KSI9_9FIRM|nr:hypothetical protein SpAn4DRAFT_1326 [Sporomusa ovata]